MAPEPNGGQAKIRIAFADWRKSGKSEQLLLNYTLQVLKNVLGAASLAKVLVLHPRTFAASELWLLSFLRSLDL